MKTDEVSRLLTAARVAHEAFWVKGRWIVYVTDAGQLFATKRCFDRSPFREDRGYGGWEAHHVVEDDHLRMMGWSARFPAYEDCACVLLPAGAHRGRFNRIIGRVGSGGVGRNVVIDDDAFVAAYRHAYEEIGAYTGASQERIAAELTAVVRAVVRRGRA